MPLDTSYDPTYADGYTFRWGGYVFNTPGQVPVYGGNRTVVHVYRYRLWTRTDGSTYPEYDLFGVQGADQWDVSGDSPVFSPTSRYTYLGRNPDSTTYTDNLLLAYVTSPNNVDPPPGGDDGDALPGPEEDLFAAVALGLCAPPTGASVRVNGVRVGGQTLPAANWRYYPGDEEQLPDPYIMREHGDLTPAHRGLAYIVLVDVPLDEIEGGIDVDISVGDPVEEGDEPPEETEETFVDLPDDMPPIDPCTPAGGGDARTAYGTLFPYTRRVIDGRTTPYTAAGSPEGYRNSTSRGSGFGFAIDDAGNFRFYDPYGAIYDLSDEESITRFAQTAQSLMLQAGDFQVGTVEYYGIPIGAIPTEEDPLRLLYVPNILIVNGVTEDGAGQSLFGRAFTAIDPQQALTQLGSQGESFFTKTTYSIPGYGFSQPENEVYQDWETDGILPGWEPYFREVTAEYGVTGISYGNPQAEPEQQGPNVVRWNARERANGSNFYYVEVTAGSNIFGSLVVGTVYTLEFIGEGTLYTDPPMLCVPGQNE